MKKQLIVVLAVLFLASPVYAKTILGVSECMNVFPYDKNHENINECAPIYNADTGGVWYQMLVKKTAQTLFDNNTMPYGGDFLATTELSGFDFRLLEKWYYLSPIYAPDSCSSDPIHPHGYGGTGPLYWMRSDNDTFLTQDGRFEMPCDIDLDNQSITGDDIDECMARVCTAEDNETATYYRKRAFIDSIVGEGDILLINNGAGSFLFECSMEESIEMLKLLIKHVQLRLGANVIYSPGYPFGAIYDPLDPDNQTQIDRIDRDYYLYCTDNETGTCYGDGEGDTNLDNDTNTSRNCGNWGRELLFKKYGFQKWCNDNNVKVIRMDEWLTNDYLYNEDNDTINWQKWYYGCVHALDFTWAHWGNDSGPCVTDYFNEFYLQMVNAVQGFDTPPTITPPAGLSTDSGLPTTVSAEKEALFFTVDDDRFMCDNETLDTSLTFTWYYREGGTGNYTSVPADIVQPAASYGAWIDTTQIQGCGTIELYAEVTDCTDNTTVSPDTYYIDITSDLDGDGVDDGCDNCPMVVNAGQYDNDTDGRGDVCDVSMKDIWGYSDTSIYAVGDNNTILEYNGTYFTPMATTLTTRETINSVWGGGWISFAAATNGRLLGRAEWLPTQPWGTFNTGIQETLYSVHGCASNDVYAVGDNGTILYFDGEMDNMTSSCNATLSSVWCSDNDSVFAAGLFDFNAVKAPILYYNGTSWTDIGPTGWYWHADIWAASETDVFVVGGGSDTVNDGGTILHYDGSSWTPMESGSSEVLFAVWGTASDDVYAVGDNGTVIHYNGSAWSAVDTDTSARLKGVWQGQNDPFIVGDDFTVLK